MILYALAVLCFAFGIVYQVRDNPALLVLVVFIVVFGSILANITYRWLQAAGKRQAAARMEKLRIPRTRLVDALMNLTPQDVALLTAHKTQRLAQDLAVPGSNLPASRLAEHRDLLGAVRLYVNQNSNKPKLWSNPEAPSSLMKTVEATDRIIGELQQRSDGGTSPGSIPRGEVEQYAGRLTAQSGAFEQLAGAA
jgi:hypothetical protein